MNTDELIQQLANEGAQQPLMHPIKRALLWYSGAFAFVFTAIYLKGFRADLLDKLNETDFILETVILLSITLYSAATAFYSARPEGISKYSSLPIYLFMLCLVILTIYTSDTILHLNHISHAFESLMLACSCKIIIVSLLPTIVMFYLLRKGATIHQKKTGFFAALSTSLYAYLFMRYVEPVDDIFHLVLWHVTPVMLLCFIISYASIRILKW